MEFFQANHRDETEVINRLAHFNKQQLTYLIDYVRWHYLPPLLTTREEELYLAIQLVFSNEMYLELPSYDKFYRTNLREVLLEQLVYISPLLEKFSKYTRHVRLSILYYLCRLVLEEIAYANITLTRYIHHLSDMPGIIAKEFPGYLDSESLRDVFVNAIINQQEETDVVIPE